MALFDFQTIYLKNLSSRVSETDLVSLFNRFQNPDDPKIVFRLLKGRMKGQAFVKFASKLNRELLLILLLLNSLGLKHKECHADNGRF